MIARLCEWSMSMEFRMTAFSLRKTPLVSDIKVERPLQFCRRSNGDRRLWLSCASACVLEQRVQQDLAYPAICAIVGWRVTVS
jgi:hypothetical protein